MRFRAPAPSSLASTVALLAPDPTPAGPDSRLAPGRHASPQRSRLTVYRGVTMEELPAHAPRRPNLYDLPAPSVFRVTSHLDLFSADKLWADACFEYPYPPRSEFEVQARVREANQLRARLHVECLIDWLEKSERIIEDGESIERVHFGTILRAAALSNGVEDMLGHRVEQTFSVLSRAWWALWVDFPFRQHAKYLFHKKRAGGLFTYNDVDFGLTHGLLITWWKPGNPLPPVSDR